MENADYYNPTKVIYGKDRISEIGKEISSRGHKKVLLLCGSGSIKKNGVYEQVMDSLKGLKIFEVWGVQPNPLLEKVEEAILVAKSEKVDCVLAVGGGSVIDSAKALCAGYYLKNVWKAYEDWSIVKKALPLFTVLTLSATGTEMNPNSVLTNGDKKWAVINPVLSPVVSVIDPSVQASLPWRQTVNGAVDALSHIMEGYFLGTDEDTTMCVDEGLMKAIFNAVDTLQKDESNYSARANLALAATMALNGVSGRMLPRKWSVHPIEHGISAVFPSVAHAEGLAVLFPAWIKVIHKENEPTFKRWAKEFFQTDEVFEAVEGYKEKLHAWGAPVSLTDLSIQEEDLEKIADNALARGNIQGIVEFDKELVMKVLREAL
jgi:alcohol dehydrogenase YqhD (iron-dependent ADH family)